MAKAKTKRTRAPAARKPTSTGRVKPVTPKLSGLARRDPIFKAIEAWEKALGCSLLATGAEKD